jgi:hypothetical protein
LLCDAHDAFEKRSLKHTSSPQVGTGSPSSTTRSFMSPRCPTAPTTVGALPRARPA